MKPKLMGDALMARRKKLQMRRSVGVKKEGETTKDEGTKEKIEAPTSSVPKRFRRLSQDGGEKKKVEDKGRIEKKEEGMQSVTPSNSGQKGGAMTTPSLVQSKASPCGRIPRSTVEGGQSVTPSSRGQKGGEKMIAKKKTKENEERKEKEGASSVLDSKQSLSPLVSALKAKKSSGLIGKRLDAQINKNNKKTKGSEKESTTLERSSHQESDESIHWASNVEIREKRSPMEEAIRAQLQALSAKKKAEDGGEMKENNSVPSPFSSSSTTTTPKLKNAKSQMRDSAPSPSVSLSSTATTPQSNKKKEKKNKKGKEKGGVDSETKTDKMRAALTAIRRKSLEERMEADREHVRAIESGDDDWPTMRAFVPVRKEGHEEQQRLKKETKMKKKGKMVEPSATELESTVPKPAPGTVPASNHGPALPSPSTVSKYAVHPTPRAIMSTSMNGTPLPPPNGTVPKSAPGTVPRPMKSGTVSKQAPPTTTVHSAKSGPTVPYPVRDTVPQTTVNGTSGTSTPMRKHIRFASESPVKPSLPSSRANPSIDEGRSVEIPSGSTTHAAAAAVGETRRNGRGKRNSSLEVSTTSSDSSGDEKKEEEKIRKKILTKKPEVTSSVKESKVSTMTSSTPVVSPKMKSGEKSKTKKKVKRKSKVEDGKTANVTEPSNEKKEEEETRLRPSSDLLQMVAERLTNSHGIQVFRLISRETRRIAEQQLRKADSTLHLEEFDDENAFSRDDMTQWWEERREAEDTTVAVGKENRSHAQVSAYLNMRSVEKKLLRDVDGGMSHPSSAADSVDSLQLLQHPLATLDAACLLHESQTTQAARLLQQEGRQLREVWLGHTSAKLVREVKRLTAVESFEHRQATMETFEKLPLLQMTELRLDIVDDEVTRSAVSDHLVNGQNLRALELNIAPTGPQDGNTASHYTLFTKRSYDRADYTDDLEWMLPNVEDGEPDPITLCMPSLEHMATNVANVKLFWQLRDSTLLLRHLRSVRVGTLSRTRELITSSELFADTTEKRKFKQPGFFSLRDAYETVLESITLRLADRVGMCRLQRETATLFEAIGELPPSLRRLSTSLFYNQFSGVCAPFRKWAEPGVEAPDTDHIGIEEMHLHFERAFDLRGLPALLPRTIKRLSIAVNYENEDDARCLGSFIEMLSGLERLECLEDLHIQVWGVRCLQPLVASVAACSSLAARLTRLAVAAYPVDDAFFEGDAFSSWLRSSLSFFPRIRTFGLHAAVLVRMVPEERRSGYSWRNGVAWLANEALNGRQIDAEKALRLDEVELAAAPALPVLDDGEDYTITPHWEVEYNADELVLSLEDEEANEEIEDASYSIPRGDECSDEEDDFVTDGEEEEDHPDASHDDLERMEEGLEDETEKIERREKRREEKVRAAIERGEMKEGEEEEEGELIDFDSISDQEEEETQPKSEFFDDEAVESGREESGDEENNEKHEESADSDCSSEDDDRQREEERMKEERRRQNRMDRKQTKMDDEVDRRKRKRVLDSDEDEDVDMTIVIRGPINKKKKVIIESDDE